MTSVSNTSTKTVPKPANKKRPELLHGTVAPGTCSLLSDSQRIPMKALAVTTSAVWSGGLFFRWTMPFFGGGRRKSGYVWALRRRDLSTGVCVTYRIAVRLAFVGVAVRSQGPLQARLLLVRACQARQMVSVPTSLNCDNSEDCGAHCGDQHYLSQGLCKHGAECKISQNTRHQEQAAPNSHRLKKG
jgi:hypothetical protein